MKINNQSKLLLLLIFLIICTGKSLAADLDGILPSKSKIYVITLLNGDMLSGPVVELINDPKEGEGIKVKTEIGTATIFANQIKSIYLKDDYYRHKHRVFLMPTAEPIGSDHFIGSFELLLLYGGFGISDYLSVTAGRSLVPGIASREQFSMINAKVSLFSMDFKSDIQNIALAIGGNLAFINSRNKLSHLYAVTTIRFDRTRVSASIFTKTGANDYYILTAQSNIEDLIYEDGSFGLAAGIDTKIPKWHTMHFIGELWNSNVEKPTNTAIFLGLRHCNERISADFGLALFTQPFVIPFFGFSWTPF